MGQIKAIISDFDGTLANTFDANYMAYKETFKEVCNIDLNKDFYFNNFGLRIDNICKLLNIYDNNILKQIKIKKSEYYPKYFKYIKINYDLLNIYKYFKNQGIKITLATTATHKNIYNVLNYLKLINFFDLIVCGDDVKHGKPDPEVYNISLQKLNLKSDEVLVFEDSIAGMQSSINANINFIQINLYKSYE